MHCTFTAAKLFFMRNLHTKLLFLLCLASVEIKAQTSNCSPPTQKDSLDINNVNAWVLNGGDMWWDLVAAAKYEVPYNPNEKHAQPFSLFAGGLWVAGIDHGGQLHIAASTYRQNGNDYFPGPLDANGLVTQNTCEEFDKMWKINKTTIDSFRIQTFPVQASSIPSNILTWPAKGNPFDTMANNRDLAPFIDVNGDGIYNPTTGDYPDILGDQSIWWVYNDMGNKHGETEGQALGIQVQEQAFAYKTNDDLNNATFYQYKLIYNGSQPLDSVYIGFFVDISIGCYVDDYIGCDTVRNMAIGYNAQAWDGGDTSVCLLNYGNQPPMVGVDFLGGKGFPSNESFNMSKFVVWRENLSPCGFPQNANQYYNYMTGTWKDGTYWTWGDSGYGGLKRTNYLFPDNPGSSGWAMCNTVPLSKVGSWGRAVMSSGPHHLNPGDVRYFYVGVPWSRPPVGTYPCPDLNSLDQADDLMQSFFDGQIITTGIPTINQPANEIISVFPNPATDNVTMNFSDNQPKQVTLYNVLGVEVKQYLNVQGKTLIIERDGLTQGLYFYQVDNSEGKKISGKIIFE
jgi:hypothetical protein